MTMAARGLIASQAILAPDFCDATFIIVAMGCAAMTLARKVLAIATMAFISFPVLATAFVFPVGLAAGETANVVDVVYRSTTGSGGSDAPKNRTWGSAWTEEAEQADAGSSIRGIRIAASPVTKDVRIFVTQGNDGWLDAYVCNANCTVTNDIGRVWSSRPSTVQTRFDLAYEQRSGEALLVYNSLSSDPAQDIAYRTYGAGGWSDERFLDDSSESSDVQYSLLRLAARTGSDQIGLVGGDVTNDDVNAWIWDGGVFGTDTEITADALSPTRDLAAIAWESGSGHLLAMAVDNANREEVTWKEYTSSWSPASQQVCGGPGNDLRWLSLKANPVATANDMVLAAGDGGSPPELGTCYWSGTSWSPRVEATGSLDASSTRAFDFAWESSGSKGILVYGANSSQISYRTFVAPSTWSSQVDSPMGTDSHAWVQLSTNPFPAAGEAKVLGAVLEDGNPNPLGAISWNDPTFTVIGADTFTADTGDVAYESFDFAYRVAGTGSGGGFLGLPFELNWFTVLAIIAAVTIVVLAVVGVRRRRRRRGTP